MSNCRVCQAETNGFMCKACLAGLERAIGDFPSLMHEVSNLATGQTNVYRSSGRRQADPEPLNWDQEQKHIDARLRSREGRITLPSTRLMVNLEARQILWDAGNTLSTWARHLAESRGAELPTSEALVGWLLTNANSIRFDEAAAEIHDEISYAHRQMERAVDRSPSRIYAGPCHAKTADGKCQRPLYAKFDVWQAAKDASGETTRTVTCDGYRPPSDPKRSEYDMGCGAEHTVDERAEWLLAELHDRNEPLVFWQMWLPKLRSDLVWPARSTWWKWGNPDEEDKQRGRPRAIEPRSVTSDGDELFNGGEVIDLVIRLQSRIVGNRTNHRSKKRRCA